LAAPDADRFRGYQVFSLANTRKVDEDGVTFKSHIDGAAHRFTPEKSVKIQENLGADIIMAFDECAPPYDRQYNERAVIRTHAWAERSIAAKTRSDQHYLELSRAASFGFAPEIGRILASLIFQVRDRRLSVGETKPEMHSMLEVVDPLLRKTNHAT